MGYVCRRGKQGKQGKQGWLVMHPAPLSLEKQCQFLFQLGFHLPEQGVYSWFVIIVAPGPYPLSSSEQELSLRCGIPSINLQVRKAN